MPFLLQTNLLLDFRNNKIILTKSKKCLKKYGINLETMNKFRLEPDERGLILKADTVIGPLRFLINTGATVSGFRSSLLDQSWTYSKQVQKDHRGLSYIVSPIHVGSTDLGWKRLYLFELTDQMTWVDGWLGIDFFDRHVVYIDYPRKTVYVS